ncbi:atrial natriuretic peptide receptor 1-like [Mytilus californianus]|uniref:atrial natriuretic peptide receptor 1-like n=1 Tax=Mytilus californianus TaxID=6549 RepID=UPI0022469EA3|nr:atrial natriuretic peptide receptor 1-like [Mytilus californianus]
MYQKLWVAPEHLRYPSLIDGSRKGDVYSFGILMQEVITRSPPYNCCNEVIDTVDIIARVASKEKPPYRPNFASDDCPISLHKLMVMCWTEDPENRPEFSAVLKQIRKQTGGSEDDLIDSLLRRMERYTLNLEDIVEERTHQLAAEKKRSDELLYQILPQSVAIELRLGKFVTPEWFDCVTIYFSDIVGFTELSGSSSPMEVISLLNDLYSNFDSIIETFDVYKVETIGDAYMVVSGLPIRNGSDHAAAICKLSLKLLQQIQNFVIRHRPDQKLRLRIGIHTGPCVAGVVGLKMPRYCLFGDTVNVASRMESSGDACKIHISNNTKEILDRIGSFDVEERGQINIKGKGVMTTYWLKAEKKTTTESSISRTDLDS